MNPLEVPIPSLPQPPPKTSPNHPPSREEIGRGGRQRLTDFRLYPPKVVIKTASEGKLELWEFNSGQACSHLRSLGFEIVEVKDAGF